MIGKSFRKKNTAIKCSDSNRCHSDCAEIFKDRAFCISIIFFISSFLIHELSAQSTLDTLSIVNSRIKEKRLDEAAKLLEHYCHSHPKDFNAIWLYAQDEYWLGHFTHAIELYSLGKNLQPTNAYLQLDYARVLLNMGKYKKSQTLLLKLRDYDVTREAAMYEMVKLYYWQKNNLQAKKEAEELLKANPKNEATKNLLNDILISSSPWVKMATGYTTDTQPIQSASPSLEGGVALHKFLAPYAGAYSPFYNYSGKTASAKWFIIGNQFSFGKGSELKLDMGSVQFPYQGKQDITGHIGLRQKLNKSVTFDVQAEHKPYFNTLRSLDTIVTVNHFSSSLELNSETGAIGKIAFEDNHFADGNDVYSIYGYLLSKSIKFLGSKLRIGYSLAFNDSKDNRFVPTQTISEMVAAYNKGNYQISGIYDPYFTPQQQQINSLVLSFLFPIGKKIKFGVNANGSFYATTFNPYYYLQKKNQVTYTLTKDYATIQYSPMEASTYIEWTPSVTWSIRADYQYRKTFFFNSQFVGLSVRAILFNEKK